ncbi:MAG: hypothetical protein WAT66_05015 [Actinomycetota bacterium]
MATTTHEMPSIGDPARPRAVLRLNALAAVAAGSMMLLLAGPLARILGLEGRGLLAAAGLILVALGSDELFIAVRRGLRRAHLYLVAFADLAILGAGVAFLAAGPAALTFLERGIVAVAAVALGWFAIAVCRTARLLP